MEYIRVTKDNLEEETAERRGIAFKAIKIESREAAQNAPTPITTFALFCDGGVCHE